MWLSNISVVTLLEHLLIWLKFIYFFFSVAEVFKHFLRPLHIDRIWVVSWRCWFTRVKEGFSQEKCNLVNSGCWMFALHLLPSIPLSSSAAGNLTTLQASPGKWRQITWDFWMASLIMTDSINVMLIFYISPHKPSFWWFCVVCVFSWCNAWLWWITSLGLFQPTFRGNRKI